MTAQGKDINMKTLVAYFSAESGRTASLAEKMASAIGADLFEIKPEKPYSAADLNYMNPVSRCNREFFAKKQVPVSGKIQNFAACGEHFLRRIRLDREESCSLCNLRRQRNRQNSVQAGTLRQRRGHS